MAFLVGMAAGLCTIAAIALGVVTFLMSPFNDLGRVYGRIAAVFLGLIAVSLWVLFGHLLSRFDNEPDLDS